ncbi:MAG: MOSC domain-containing protein [Methyloligellaceae bacterium]
MHTPYLESIYRFPVKGFTGESLDSCNVFKDEMIPFDRIYAIENGSQRFDSEGPQYLPKINFLMLMRNERVALLDARFDEQNHTLEIRVGGKAVTKGDLRTKIGRDLIEQFLAAFFRTELRGAPKIVSAENHNFSDVPDKWLHIINLQSIRELERITNQKIHPLRFRANLYVDKLPPWSEFDLIGKAIKIGRVELEVMKRTTRCEATNVDPETAQRDLSIPSQLMRSFGHSDFGIYAAVKMEGQLNTGDKLTQL